MIHHTKSIVLSAGGTGGHVMPAQALGEDLLSRGFKVILITDARGARYADLFEGVDVKIVRAGTLGPGLFDKIAGSLNLGRGFLDSLVFLKRLKPALVVGFGGYPSVPAVFAAQKLKIPTIIHEQNAVIGRANAFLAAKADRIALSLPGVRGLDQAESVRAIITGNPVRPEIAALYTQAYPALEPDGVFRILIFGGSLGASVFSEVIPAALAALSGADKARLEITQQCRGEDIKSVQKIYEKAGIKASLTPFFKDMAQKLAAAHLVISRAGASTVAEIAVAGRPAIFVPYPHHKDRQQKRNAETITAAGGAWVMEEEDFTKEALRARIETFLQTPETLFRAAEQARSCGLPDAARKLGNLVTAIASGWG